MNAVALKVMKSDSPDSAVTPIDSALSRYARPTLHETQQPIIAEEKIVKVLLDARKLGHGGIGIYIKNILSGVCKTPDIRVTALVQPGQESQAMSLGAANTITDAAKLYSYDELVNLKKRIPFKDFDLFHTPHFTLPFGIPIPTVVTIHDTIQISHPEKMFYPLIAKALIRSSLKRATKIITVSEATKSNLIKLQKKSESKIEIIPNAVDPLFFIDVPEDGGSSITEPYIVAVLSNLKPHKGMQDLFKAFTAIKEKSRIQKDISLVLVGTGAEQLKMQGLALPHAKIINEGQTTTARLKSLLLHASALVVASTVEGFCLPVIEAQACGTPVIARPARAVLELMTTNDHVAKDFSLASLEEAIVEFFERRQKNTELLERGVPLSHMCRFDREEVTKKLAETYHQLAHK